VRPPPELAHALAVRPAPEHHPICLLTVLTLPPGGRLYVPLNGSSRALRTKSHLVTPRVELDHTHIPI
jgi:hypothetical protein